MRKWFLCFHPGNCCISAAAAAIYHYANVARVLIFVYSLYKAYCDTSPFHSGSLFAGGFKNEQSSSNCFWDFFFFCKRYFGKHKPDVTLLHKQPEQIRPVA